MSELSIEDNCKLVKMAKELESDALNHNKEIELAHEFVLLTRKLLKNNDFKDLMKIDNYKKVVISFYKIENIDVIIVLSSIDTLINRKQREILREYYMQEANNWNTVDNNQKFLAKIKNSHILEYMSNVSINDSFKSFNQIIKDLEKNDVLKAIYLLEDYRKFLKEVRETNQAVDASLINLIIQFLQKKYQELEPLARSEMKEHKFLAGKFSDSKIEEIQTEIKKQPLKIVNSIMPATEAEIFEWMCANQDKGLLDFVTITTSSTNGIEVKNRFDKLNFFDEMIQKLMRRIVKEDKGINLHSERGINNYYQDYIDAIRLTLGLLISMMKIKDVYNLVGKEIKESNLPFSLVDFDENKIKIGHITQLFPILEIEIRKLGEKYNILPTKENLRYKIKFKDPSEILKKIIQKKSNIEENHYGFRDCRLELFLYYALYAANGLNVRNQCIHAREYFKGEELEFGLGVSLFCLHLLLKNEENSE